MNEDNDSKEIQRLPLWKNVVEEMRSMGLQYGQTFPSEFFEERLKVTRDQMRFGLDISEIRRELEHDGFRLSGVGQKGNQQVIVPLKCNSKVMESYQRRAFDAMKRGVILGTNSPIHLLPDEDRRKHEALLERMATRLVLMQRSKQTANILAKHSPRLLNKAS